MGRPKLDDPTVPIAFRMRRSCWEWWLAEADRRGMKATQFLRQELEAVAENGQAKDER